MQKDTGVMRQKKKQNISKLVIYTFKTCILEQVHSTQAIQLTKTKTLKKYVT